MRFIRHWGLVEKFISRSNKEDWDISNPLYFVIEEHIYKWYVSCGNLLIALQIHYVNQI